MESYGQITKGFWKDQDFKTYNKKIMWLYITSEADIIGLVEYAPLTTRSQTGLTKAKINEALTDFEAQHKIFWVDNGNRIWIPSCAWRGLSRGFPSEKQQSGIQNRLKSVLQNFKNGEFFIRKFYQVIETKYPYRMPFPITIILDYIRIYNRISSYEDITPKPGVTPIEDKSSPNTPPPSDSNSKYSDKEQERRWSAAEVVEDLKKWPGLMTSDLYQVAEKVRKIVDDTSPECDVEIVRYLLSIVKSKMGGKQPKELYAYLRAACNNAKQEGTWGERISKAHKWAESQAQSDITKITGGLLNRSP